MSEEHPANVDQLCAVVRPGMHKSDLEPLLAMMSHHLSSYSLAARCAISFDAADRVRSVCFLRDFPPEIVVEGVHVGSDLDAALRSYPGLALAHRREWPDGSVVDELEGGLTDKGYEFSARVLEGKVLAFDFRSPDFAAERSNREKAKQARIDSAARWERSRVWRTIADPDAMLEDWAAYGSISDDWVPTLRSYARWLRNASPVQRHQAARAWNWDYGLAPLLWIVRQPDTDLATIISIYFDASPSFFADYGWDRERVPEHALDLFDLIEEIFERVRSGAYTRSRIALDGEEQFKRYVGTRGKPEHAIFARDLAGEFVGQGAFADGFPEEIYPLD